MTEGLLSPVQLFLNADPVVKMVVVILLMGSLWSWIIIFESLWILRQLRSAVATTGRSGGHMAQAVTNILATGLSESKFQSNVVDRLGRQQAVSSVMKRRAQELMDLHQSRLSNLAVVASVAPFVGLFGTVWGIMSSFAGIAAAKDTSLAVVAPGIAEALAATAIGLAAAIPAAFAYNQFAAAFGRTSRSLGRLIDDTSARMTSDRYYGDAEPRRSA